jgi:hypothetical protein
MFYLIPVEGSPFGDMPGRQQGGPVEPDNSLAPAVGPDGVLRITVAPNAPMGPMGSYAERLAPFLPREAAPAPAPMPEGTAPSTTAAQAYMAEPRPSYVSPATIDDNGYVAYTDSSGGLSYTDNTRHELRQDDQGSYHVYQKAPPEAWGAPPYVPASGRRVGPQPAPESIGGQLQEIGQTLAAPFQVPAGEPMEKQIPWAVQTGLGLAGPGTTLVPKNALGMAGSRPFRSRAGAYTTEAPQYAPEARAGMGGNQPPPEFAMQPPPMVQLVPHEGPAPLWMHEVPGELPEAPHVPVGHGPHEHELSSVPLLGEGPPQAPRSRNVWDIAKGLHQRGIAALRKMGIMEPLRETNRTAETDEILARTLAHETKAAMARSGHAGDWYTKSVEDAVNTASLVYPEIARDRNARFAFLVGHAITSQNETVGSNVRLAQQAYEHYKKTGRFPTNIKASKEGMINGNFEKLNTLLDGSPEKGITGMTTAELRTFMNKEYSVRDLDAMGFNMSDFAKDDIVPGSAILGPKIGHGFFQNLNGNFSPVTVDLWAMRTWGRLTGTLSGIPAAIPKSRARFEAALEAARMPVPGNIRSLSNMADRIVAEHERDYIRNRELYKSGEKTKSELTKSAERLQINLHGIKEQPSSAAERRWINDVVNRTRELLAKEGHTMTNADIQAALWYPEKDIYAKLGGRPSEEINLSYAQAWRNVMKEKHGMSDEQIDTAIRALERGY